MTELETYVERQKRRADARLQGKTIETTGGLTISAEREHTLRELPIYENFRQPLQNTTTGEPLFMLGVDALS